MIFEDLDLHPRLLAGLGPLASQSPTPVQEQALPPILEGRDVLVLAPPTEDKMLIFVLPILQHTLFGPRGRIQAVILTPTQELAEAAVCEFQHVARHTRVRSLALCAGQITAQLEALRDGVEIIVACPAQLLEHLDRGSIDLSRVELFVLEQLDQLSHMGFLPDLWRILKATPAERQMLLFTATDNEELRQLAQALLHAPTIVQIGDVAAVPDVKHQLYHVDAELKAEALLTLLDLGELPARALLIFCDTRFRARRLGEKLKHAGYATAILTDELSPKRRALAIEGYRKNTFGIIVTTDAAAQGLNVTNITHIVNFDMPTAVGTYLHRTGRAAHDHGSCTAINLVTPEDTEILDAISMELGERPERRTLPSSLA